MQEIWTCEKASRDGEVEDTQKGTESKTPKGAGALNREKTNFPHFWRLGLIY